MSEWREVTLEGLCSLISSGGTPKRSEPRFYAREPDGYRWVKSQELRDGSVWDTQERISDLGLAKSSAKLYPPETVLVAMYGATVGVLGYLRVEAAVNQAICGLVVNRKAADARFVYYALREARRDLIAGAAGAAQQNINQGQIRAFRIRVPEPSTQRRIGALLGAIDDLIENSRRRIALLEQMAQAIYREWFVHLHYPGHEDDELVDSPLGPLPQGWSVLSLSRVASIVMGHSPKSEHYNDAREGLPFHQGVANFGPHYPHHRLYCRIDGRIAEANDHLVSVRAPVGRINRSDRRVVIGRGLAAVRSKAGLQSLLGHELRRVFREEDSMGGGTIFKAITKGDLEGIPIIQPTAKIGRRAEEILAIHDEMIRVLTFGSRALASLRDLLLPKLVTGAIDVSHLDLDALLEETAT